MYNYTSDFTVPGTGTEDSVLCPSVKASRHFLSVPRYFGTVILLIFRTKYAFFVRNTRFSYGFFVVLQPFLDPAVVMANYYCHSKPWQALFGACVWRFLVLYDALTLNCTSNQKIRFFDIFAMAFSPY